MIEEIKYGGFVYCFAHYYASFSSTSGGSLAEDVFPGRGYKQHIKGWFVDVVLEAVSETKYINYFPYTNN